MRTGQDTAVHLLDVVPQLAEHLGEEQVRAARQAILAPAVDVRRGPWDRASLAGHPHAPSGAIVLSGPLARNVDIGGYPGSE